MTSDFYFTATSWFPGNVRVKPHSKHSAPPQMLILSQPLGADCAHHITTEPLGFLDISTALCCDMLSSAALLWCFRNNALLPQKLLLTTVRLCAYPVVTFLEFQVEIEICFLVRTIFSRLPWKVRKFQKQNYLVLIYSKTQQKCFPNYAIAFLEEIRKQ